MRLVNFHAEEYDIDRWKVEAKASKMSMSEWIRRRLNGRSLTEGPTAPKLVKVAKVGVAKTVPVVCEHRLPKGAYCKSCQVLRK